MSVNATIAILYAVGLVLLLGDFFLPSHGVLTLASLGLLGYALYLTFEQSEKVGFLSLVGLVFVVPAMLVFAVKTWHRTPIGRRISPPNPVLGEADRLPIEDLRSVLGTSGRSLTPLRPVGVCEFENRRVECAAESG